MLSESDIEAAHPEAFDFVWGNLPTASRADFDRHLLGCRYCQAVVDEYADIGQIIQRLPPHVEPPAHLEDRTVAAMVAALAKQRAKADRRSEDEDQAATRAYPIPERRPPAEPKTQVQPIPQLQPPAEDEAQLRRSARRSTDTGRDGGQADGHPPASVAAPPGPPCRCRCRRRCDHHRRHLGSTQPGRRPDHSGPGHGPREVVIPLSATAAAKAIGYGAATGRAIGSSRHCLWQLGHHPDRGRPEEPGRLPWYECWYVSPDIGKWPPLARSSSGQRKQNLLHDKRSRPP